LRLCLRRDREAFNHKLHADKWQDGGDVTITGKDLIGTTAIEIGGVTATFKIGSTTRITAIVPKDGKTGKIHVTTTPHPGHG